MCALYQVTRSGYYAWRRRGNSARRRQDRLLLDAIRAAFDRSRRTYSMKSDTVHGVTFARDVELAHVLRSYIPYYNSVRLHSGIGYASPVNYEARAQ